MKITKVEYDSDEGVVHVGVDLPLVGDATLADAWRFLQQILLETLPPDYQVKVEKK